MPNNKKPVNGFDKRPEDINYSGRPPSYFNGILREFGEKINKKTGIKYKNLVSKRLWISAINGDISAIREIMNRLDGMPHQSIGGELEVKGGLVMYLPKRNAK